METLYWLFWIILVIAVVVVVVWYLKSRKKEKPEGAGETPEKETVTQPPTEGGESQGGEGGSEGSSM